MKNRDDSNIKYPYLPNGEYVIVSDLQVPYHDQRAVDAVCDHIARYGYDGMMNVGDEGDSPEPSRWNRGSAAEYAGTFEAGLLETQRVMKQLSDALGPYKPHHVMRSNHADRIQTYVNRYAPALAGLSSLTWEKLIGYQTPSTLNGVELDLAYHRRPWQFAKGWVLAHGDEGALNQTAGSTAMGMARKWGLSVVCGHTHKAGFQHQHRTLNGTMIQPIFGIEVGHLMDMKKAGYLKAASANWQQAIAVATIDGSVTDVRLRMIHKGRVF